MRITLPLWYQNFWNIYRRKTHAYLIKKWNELLPKKNLFIKEKRNEKKLGPCSLGSGGTRFDTEASRREHHGFTQRWKNRTESSGLTGWTRNLSLIWSGHKKNRCNTESVKLGHWPVRPGPVKPGSGVFLLLFVFKEKPKI